jgi:DsbC/DsbD-like thiol-disulfide interchange protein
MRRRWPIAVLLWTGSLVLTIASSARAQTAETHAKIELISDPSSHLPNGPIWAGLLFRLDPGWHIYWHNAGDSGEPPKVQWQLPLGFTAGSIRWPTPTRLGNGSIVDYGFEGEVLLMAPIGLPQNSNLASVPVSADVKYVVCREICIPGKAHLTLSIPLGDDTASQTRDIWRERFRNTRARLPRPAPAAWRIAAKADKNHIVLSVKSGTRVSNATFFPDEPGVIENSAPQDFAAEADGFRLTLQKSQQLLKPVAVLKGLLVIGSDGGSDQGTGAYQIAAPVSQR